MNFSGFPGEWTPGVPVEAAALAAAAGLTPEALLTLADETGVPLTRVKVNSGTGPVAWPDNHVPAGAVAVLEPEAEAEAAEPDAGEGAEG